MKNRKRIGERGEPCGIPDLVGIQLLSNPEKAILVCRSVKKHWMT